MRALGVSSGENVSKECPTRATFEKAKMAGYDASNLFVTGINQEMCVTNALTNHGFCRVYNGQLIQNKFLSFTQ